MLALYAICKSNDQSEIKIGKIAGDQNSLKGQYCCRYNSRGYTVLRFWKGPEYYWIESLLHHNPKLTPFRLRNDEGRMTEWYSCGLELIDEVVDETVRYTGNSTAQIHKLHSIDNVPVQSHEIYLKDVNKVSQLEAINKVHSALEIPTPSRAASIINKDPNRYSLLTIPQLVLKDYEL